MKFTCDSCGAQYQIADDKLGAKGVKVRCRKCQYLIIVRPKGYEPVAKTTIDPVLSSEFESPLASSDVDQTSVEPRGNNLEDSAPELSASTSSDFGISQEFRALGFDEDSGVREPPVGGISVDLDVGGMEPPPSDVSSPFLAQTSGGSLDDVAVEEEDHTRRLGVSAPPDTDDVGESTQVEPSAEQPASAWSLESETDPVTPSAPSRASFQNGNGHRGPLREGSGSNFLSGEVEVGAMLKSVERNELAEIRSSVDAEMAGLSRELDGWASGVDNRSTLDDGDDAFAQLQPRSTSAPSPVASGESVLGTGIEGELGDAFDAMFSSAQIPSEDFLRNGLSAKTEMSPRPPEPPADPGGSDKLPTRVFDSGAMATVTAEQERAVQGVVAKTKPPPEWYVAIDEAQVGPLSLDDVTQRWRDGEVGPNSLCWKQGMADWTAIRFTEGLKQLVEKEAQEPKIAASVERRQAEEDEALVSRPPQISMASEAEPPRAAAAPAKIAEAPAWRPSAASLLATLAAEELADPGPVATKERKSDVALGPAIPATSNALEKLLESSSASPVQSPFGAAEKSESAIRPLPRRPDTVSSVPLRDPTLDRPKNSNTAMIALAILGGCLVIAVALVVGPKLLAGDPPPAPPPPIPQVAPPPPPAQAGGVPGEALAAGGVPGDPNVAAGAVPAPPPAAAPPPVEAQAQAMKAADPPPPPESSAEETKSKKRSRRERTAEAKPRKEEPPPPAPPPPRAATPQSEEDDLLGVSSKPQKRLPTATESNDLPRQLDDGDILGVLRKNRDDVRGCLEKQTSADPSLDGTMTVKAVIERSGQAKRISISPDKFKTSAVGKCVGSAVQRWKFPQFSGPAIPIDFPVHVRGR